MTAMNHDTVISACKKKLSRAIIIETHASTVLLHKRHAYKIKKPVDFGFLNYATLARRKKFCQLELVLNRRFSPTIYQKILPLYYDDTKKTISFTAKKNHTLVNYALRMKRLDHKMTLDKLVPGNTRGKNLNIYQKMIGFVGEHFNHCATVKRLPASHPAGTVQQVAKMMRENFQQTEEWLTHYKQANNKKLLTEQKQYLDQLLIRCRPLIRKRKQQRSIILGHGDLHLGNLALANNKVVAFDGIEFNPEFMNLDSLNDFAFLFMDSQFRQPELGRVLRSKFLEISGYYEYAPLITLYEHYRALIRAKVHTIEKKHARAKRYIQFAASIITPHSPALIITHGLSGNGKTSLCEALLATLPLLHLSSDSLRKQICPQKKERYSDAITNQVYQTMLHQAKALITNNYSVIVDATFLHKTQRDAFRKLADSKKVPFIILSLSVDDALAKRRIEKRKRSPSQLSSATHAIREKQKDFAEALDSIEKTYAIQVFETSSAASVLSKIKKRIK